jgi:hypothetical protein
MESEVASVWMRMVEATGEKDGVGVGHGGHGVDGLLGEVAEGAATDLQRRAAGLHTLEIEDVVDETDEAIGVSNGDAEEVERLGVDVADDAGGKQTEGSANAGKWRAQFVGDGRDELVLEVIELGAMRELEGVLMVLLTGLIELICELTTGALSSQKGDQQDS